MKLREIRRQHYAAQPSRWLLCRAEEVRSLRRRARALAALTPIYQGAINVVLAHITTTSSVDVGADRMSVTIENLNPGLRRITPFSDFAEGDYVSRGDDGVHLVKNMDDGGQTADFECIKRPSSGWCEVGEVESNLCRRYYRVTWPEPRAVEKSFRQAPTAAPARLEET